MLRRMAAPQPQGAPVAWRVPGGQWEDGQPYQSDIDLLEKAKLKPEYAYDAPQPQGADAATLAKRLDKVLGCYADSMPAEAYHEIEAVRRGLNTAPQPQAANVSKDLLWWAGSLLICCQQADVQGELPECIDGGVMEKLAAAIKAAEAAPQQDERIGAWHLVFDTMLRVRPKVFHNDKTAQQAVCDEIEAMAAALAATPQPLAEPVGEWVMVPRNATPEMVAAAIRDADCPRAYVEPIYRALLAAAPQPQASPQASAEDVALVGGLVRQSGLAGPTIKAAWQRIEADMIRLLGVGRE
jgi:hypothetical protein